MTTEEKIYVMNQFLKLADDEELIYRRITKDGSENTWYIFDTEKGDPIWNWKSFEYQIQKKQKNLKTRPFTDVQELLSTYKEILNDLHKNLMFNEYPLSPILLKTKDGSSLTFITEINFKDNTVGTTTEELSMEDLFDNYNFFSDDICGITEEEEPEEDEEKEEKEDNSRE